MSWMNSIISWLKSLEDYFYDAYLEVYSWVTPFWYLSIPLLYISRGFGWLAYYFSLFNDWLVWTNNEISSILSWSTIWSYILSQVPNLEAIRDWFYYWWDYVLDVVSEWWLTTWSDVKGYIDIAVEGLNDLIAAWNDFWNVTFPEWTGKLDTLRSEWDTFWTVTLPTLISVSWLTEWWGSRLLEIQSLIDTAIANIMPMIEDWQEWRDKVIEFIKDPEQWFYDRLEEIFERFW